MPTISFTTSPKNNGTEYQIVDQSTGYNPQDRRIIIKAFDGTVLIDDNDSTDPVVSYSTSDWGSHLGLIQITLDFIYLYDTVQKTYLLPTTLNLGA